MRVEANAAPNGHVGSERYRESICIRNGVCEAGAITPLYRCLHLPAVKRAGCPFPPHSSKETWIAGYSGGKHRKTLKSYPLDPDHSAP